MEEKYLKDALLIEYRGLGTITIDELAHAIMEDIQTLKEEFNVRYVTGVRLHLPVTNEYGDPLRLKRPGGGKLRHIDTHHYRPACLDYKL